MCIDHARLALYQDMKEGMLAESNEFATKNLKEHLKSQYSVPYFPRILAKS